jgi:Domain of unknown function (DUF4270)
LKAKTSWTLSKKYIQKWPSSGLVLLLITFGLSSCEDPVTKIGSELLKPSDLVSTIFTDTLTVNYSTVLLDSVVTSSSNKLLVGRYVDPVFGSVEAKTYFQITNVDSIAANSNSVLDSIVLNLGYKYYYGDTLKPQSFTIHRVLDKIGQNTGSLTKRLIESLDTRNIYYNNDILNYDPVPLGKTGVFIPHPILKRRKSNIAFDSVYNTLSIKLDPAFGKELMALAGKKAGKGLVDFKEYFKGMVLVPDASFNAAILGFEPSNTVATSGLKPTYMGLHFHTKDKKDTLSNYFFVNFASNESYNNRFISLKTDRTGTPISALKLPNSSISGQIPNDELYVQSGTGISTKVEIPYLKTLAKNGNVRINKVEMIVEPVKQLSSSYPVISLNLVGVNPTDKKRPMRTATGDLASIPTETGVTSYNVNKQYVFNLTSYFQNILAGNLENNGFIITAYPDYAINRLVLNRNSIKLRVFYTKIGN